MQSKDLYAEANNEAASAASTPKAKVTTSTHVVTAESVQAEEVPTIPLGSLQTISTLHPEVSVRSTATTRSARLLAPLVVQPLEYRRSFGEWVQVWWDGIRPSYVLLALLPVLLGTILGWTQGLSNQTPFGQFHSLHFFVILIAVAALQIGANLVNDYYDYLKGVDTSNSFGPGGLIQQGLIRPARILNLGLFCLALGTLLGVVLAVSAGIYMLLLGLIGLFCAYFYSATSRSISSMALGELVSLLIYGPLLALSAYIVQAGGSFTRSTLVSVLLYSLPLGFLATAIIHANNMRDVESDIQAGKRTLASLLGLRLSRILYILLVLGAYAVVVAIGLPHHAPHFVLLTLWTLPILVVVLTGIARSDAPANLHVVMQGTMRLHLYFVLLFVAALLIPAIIFMVPHIVIHIPI